MPLTNQPTPARFKKKNIISTLLVTAAVAAIVLPSIIVPEVPAAPPVATLSTSEKVAEVELQHFSMPQNEKVTTSTVRDDYTIFLKHTPYVKSDMVFIQDATSFINDVSWDIQWPFPVGVPVSSPFGMREKPCAECPENHKGVDFTAGNGSAIQSIFTGTVREVSYKEDYGQLVIIDHDIRGQKITTYYAHLQIGSSKLKEGDTVLVGDEIGLVGSTGASTGPHLHFGVQIEGVFVDPMKWMPENVGFYPEGAPAPVKATKETPAP